MILKTKYFYGGIFDMGWCSRKCLWGGLATLGLIGSLGCTPTSSIAHRHYQISNFRSGAQVPGTLQRVRLELDRKMQKITFEQPDGTRISADFSVREKSKWLMGGKPSKRCWMEVLEINLPQLSVGSFSFRQPVLQSAGCASRAGVLLREAEQLENRAHWRCHAGQMCIPFRPSAKSP